MAGIPNLLAGWFGYIAGESGADLDSNSSTPLAVSLDIRAGKPSDVPAILPMVEKICALHQGWDPAKFGFVDHVVSMYGKWLTAQAKDFTERLPRCRGRRPFRRIPHRNRGARGADLSTV